MILTGGKPPLHVNQDELRVYVCSEFESDDSLLQHKGSKSHEAAA